VLANILAKKVALSNREAKALFCFGTLTEGGHTMRKSIRHARSIALPALVAGALLGCQTNGGGTVEVGLTSSGQSLTLAAPDLDGGGPIDTDAGTGPHLILTVNRVDIHIAGTDNVDDDALAPPSTPPPPDDDGGWFTVFTGAAQVDLLQAGSVEAFLGSGPVPAGKVTQIRLVIAQATWIDGTISKPVTCPSCTQTGLKIVTMGKIVVPAGGTLHVTLDFDRDHSLKDDKDGFRLDPVVKVARSSVH
jgi:hypothetical protein